MSQTTTSSTTMADPSTALPSDLLRLDAQACFALYSTGLAMNRLYRKLLEPLGLTYPQYLVMMVLWEKDAVSVNTIGAQLYLDSATLTPLLKRLEQSGLILRKRSSHDERQRVIELTEQGFQLKSKAETVPQQVICATQCSVPELTDLKHSLEHLRGQLLSQFHG